MIRSFSLDAEENGKAYFRSPLFNSTETAGAPEQLRLLTEPATACLPIASLQNEITELSNSIRYAGANCVANCEKWNEHQQQKQEKVEAMKAQLEEQKHHLEEMQEQARKQGFGSSIYDP